MDQYPGYREPPLARSPPERTSWGGRDEGFRDRTSDRGDRSDTFYRGRSPGTFTYFVALGLVPSLSQLHSERLGPVEPLHT